jgi:hypothetical protein
MRSWSLGVACILFSGSLQAEPLWNIAKEKIPAVGSPGYIGVQVHFEEDDKKSVSTAYYKENHWVSWRDFSWKWPSWKKLSKDGQTPYSVKRVAISSSATPLIATLGDHIRVFYEEKYTFLRHMLTLDDKGDVLQDELIDAIPIHIIRGKEESLLLWEEKNESQGFYPTKGSFFHNKSNQWGEKFELGSFLSSENYKFMDASFDGQRYVVLRVSSESTNEFSRLFALWIDPENDQPLQEISQLTGPSVPPRNLAVGCLGPGDCLFTCSFLPESVLHSGKIPYPEGESVPGKVYDEAFHADYNRPLTQLIPWKDGYLFWTYIYKKDTTQDFIEKLDAGGKYDKTISYNPLKILAVSAGDNLPYVFVRKPDTDMYLRGFSLDLEQENQDPPLQILDRDLPATSPQKVAFWGENYWVQFSLTRMSPDHSLVEESWLNQINLQGDVVNKYQIPGRLLVTGNSKALLVKGNTLFLVSLDGTHEKLMEPDLEYDNFLFDGTSFVAFRFREDGADLLYISEDGFTEEQKIFLDFNVNGYLSQTPVACGGGECLYLVPWNGVHRFILVPRKKPPFIVPGSLASIHPGFD